MHTHTHTQVYTLQYQLRMATKANNEYIIKDSLLRKKKEDRISQPVKRKGST